MKTLLPKACMALVATVLTSAGCKKESENTGTDDRSDVPAAYLQFTDDVVVYSDGDYLVVEATGLPNHTSPYWDTSDNLYEAYNGDNTNFHLNPNRIEETFVTYRIPRNPAAASSHESTPMGAMGVALNGVPLFNQYAAGGADLTSEINSFDQWLGHPQQQGQYHYHQEPIYLTQTSGRSALVGFLLDGFPVYGPEEDGAIVTNDDLDAYHGHTHATPEYPDGIYHYHITDAAPYINGDGFYGNPGTVSN